MVVTVQRTVNGRDLEQQDNMLIIDQRWNLKNDM